jgi:hypothetical protein
MKAMRCFSKLSQRTGLQPIEQPSWLFSALAFTGIDCQGSEFFSSWLGKAGNFCHWCIGAA